MFSTVSLALSFSFSIPSLPMGVLFPYEVVQAVLGISSMGRPQGNMEQLSAGVSPAWVTWGRQEREVSAEGPIWAELLRAS